jgi:hypothetical protein
MSELGHERRFVMSATRPLYLRFQKDWDSAADRRSGPGGDSHFVDYGCLLWDGHAVWGGRMMRPNPSVDVAAGLA